MIQKKNQIIIFMLFTLVALTGCNKSTDLYDEGVIIQANAKKYFKYIDPQQDWNSTVSGTITVTADADLPDIVKVQILTASPFFNDDAQVLSEAKVQKGGTVKINYDAPNSYSQLVAACVSSKDIYYIQVFNVGQSAVSFGKKAKARATRAVDESELPNAADIKLEYKNSKLSFNAERAKASPLIIKDDKGVEHTYTEWENTAWVNERLWSPTNANLGTWTIASGATFRSVDPLTEEEEANIRAICDTYLVKTGTGTDATNGKRNNWKRILDGKYFSVNNNYVVSDGTPITLTPVQLNSTEVKSNYVYYYYFDPAWVEGMTEEEEIDFIESLPKYMAVDGGQAREAANQQGKGGPDYFKANEYLLPYYGDDAPGQQGTTAVSCIIPKGYKIGFFNRKRLGSNYLSYKNGCSYGDGRLNYGTNHLAGHYLTSMDTSLGGQTVEGMDFTSPRIAFFSANNTTYMCFEDGCDCNFCDMIIEVSQGIERIDEPEDPSGAVYTMCFEDRPMTADYDMNDVVLKASIVDATHVKISLVACGANDMLYIHGVEGSKINSQTEVHALFGLTSPDQFINTSSKFELLAPVEDIVEKDASESLTDVLSRIWVENKNSGGKITLPQKPGDVPNAVIVPIDFPYPKEQTSIISAYGKFNNWAINSNMDTDWYLFPTNGLVFK